MQQDKRTYMKFHTQFQIDMFHRQITFDDERLNDDPKHYYPFLGSTSSEGHNKADPDKQINLCVAVVMLIFYSCITPNIQHPSVLVTTYASISISYSVNLVSFILQQFILAGSVHQTYQTIDTTGLIQVVVNK